VEHTDRDESSVEQIVVLERLTTVLTPVAARAWLLTPNPLLDHHTPVDLLRQASMTVHGAIDALAECVFV
jgi:uncharacterized protein (DUF2384 family)